MGACEASWRTTAGAGRTSKSPDLSEGPENPVAFSQIGGTQSE